MPGALFIHADLDSLRLQREKADVVLCLGVLMYFENLAQRLERLLEALKPGGILLLHEQIPRKSWGRILNAVFGTSPTTYPASHGIQARDLKECLGKHGSVIRMHFAGSPLRWLFMKWFDETSFQPVRPFAAWIDSLWCATVGRAFPSTGASEVQVVFRKYGGSTVTTLA